MTLTGNAIRALRESYNLAPAELALFVSVMACTVYRWEAHGARTPAGPTPRLLMLLATVPEGRRAGLALSSVLPTGGVWRAWYAVLKTIYAD